MKKGAGQVRNDLSLTAFICWGVLILLVGVYFRFTNILAISVQWIEGLNLQIAHFAMEGRIFHAPTSWGFIEIRKWLYPVVIALFQPGGPEGPFIAKIVSAILSSLSIASSMAVGYMLGSRRTGLLAGAIYALLPVNVFHERLGLADPLMAVFVALIMLFSLRLARANVPRWREAVFLGIVLAGGFLTKISILPYFAIPVVAMLFFTPRERYVRAGSRLAVSFVVASGIILAVYRLFAVHNPQLHSNVWDALYTQFYGMSPAVSEPSDRVRNILTQLRDLGDILPIYIQWGNIILAGAAVAWIIAGGVQFLIRKEGKQWIRWEEWRALMFASVPAFGFALPMLVTTGDAGYREPFFASRYLLLVSFPLCIVIALSFQVSVQKIPHHRMKRWIYRIILALLFVFPLSFDWQVVHHITEVRVPSVDRRYIDGQPSGLGFQQAADFMLAEHRRRGGVPVHVFLSTDPTQLEAMLGPRISTVEKYLGSDEQRLEIAGMLQRGEPVFFLDGGDQHSYEVFHPVKPYGALIEQVVEQESAWGTMRLYQVVGAENPLAYDIYSLLAPAPEKLEGQYAATGRVLDRMEGVVIVFPPNHAEPLSEYTEREVVPLDVNRWPLTSEAVAATLENIVGENSMEGFDLVLVDEARSDSERVILLTMLEHYYRLDGSWEGLIHRVRYFGGEVTLSSVDAVFEDAIGLESAGTDREHYEAGDVMRVQMVWQTTAPVEDAFKVFVHVVDMQGNLWAQYDSEPGSGLLPMPVWRPHQPVVDRFAISLPPDMPSGEYMLLAGIYHPEGGWRLRVTEADQGGADYVAFGSIEIR